MRSDSQPSTDRGVHQLEDRLTEYGIKVVRYIEEPV